MVLIFVIGLLMTFPVYDLGAYQFIGLPFLAFSFLITGVLLKCKIHIIPSDFFYLLFVLIASIVGLFVENQNFIMFQVFIWLAFGLQSILVRRLVQLDEIGGHILKVFSVLFGVIIIAQFVGVCFRLNIGATWNSVFGNNANYTSALALIYLPFFMNCKLQKKTLYLLFNVLLIVLIIYTKTRACLFVYFLYLFYYCSKSLFIGPNKKLYFIYIPVLTLLLVLLGISFELINSRDSARLFMITSGFSMLLDNPLFGVGLGNWLVEAQGFDVTDVVAFNDQQSNTYRWNHNSIVMLFSELGIVGFSLLCLFFIWPIKYVLSKAYRNPLMMASLESFLLFFLLSLFYCSALSYPGYYSGIQWIGFVSFGIFSSYVSPLAKHLYPLKLLLIICSLLIFIYSILNVRISRTTKILYINRAKEPDAYFQHIENIYHPMIKCCIGFNISLAHELANGFYRNSDAERAQEYYELALMDFPNNRNILHDYAEFLLFELNDHNRCLDILDRMNKIQSDHINTKILTSLAHLKKGDYTSAKDQISKVTYNPSHVFEKLESELFFHEMSDQDSLLKKHLILNYSDDKLIVSLKSLIKDYKNLSKARAIASEIMYPENFDELVVQIGKTKVIKLIDGFNRRNNVHFINSWKKKLNIVDDQFSSIETDINIQRNKMYLNKKLMRLAQLDKDKAEFKKLNVEYKELEQSLDTLILNSLDDRQALVFKEIKNKIEYR